MLLVEFAELGPQVGVGVGVGSSAKIAKGNAKNIIKTTKTPRPFLKYFKRIIITHFRYRRTAKKLENAPKITAEMNSIPNTSAISTGSIGRTGTPPKKDSIFGVA